MIGKAKNFLVDLRARQNIAIALGKGGTMMQARSIDLTNPETWEFSGFSQNGEDGILDVLRKQLKTSNRYFIEIGAADGMQNNSSWLVVAERFNGLMIDGDRRFTERARRVIATHSIGVECLNMFVTRENIRELKAIALHSNPDVFSLDIDGVDYYIAKAIIDGGFRPKIFVVEYNSVFGPDRSLTIPYQDDFSYTSAHPTHLYYGVSVAAWRKFFESQGYKFVTVDSKGVNAFFVDKNCFEETFLANISGKAYGDNVFQFNKFKNQKGDHFSLISDQKFINI